MSGIVSTDSFCITTAGVDAFYRKDVTTGDTASDAAYALDHLYFIASLGAKTANTSFFYGDRNYRKNVTRVAVGDAAYVAVPQLFS